MFNRKPNWRATIVSLVSLALLATFPLSAVTASAETGEPTPSGTVEHAATAESSEVDLKKLAAKADTPEGASVEETVSGYNAFRMADNYPATAFRSAGTDRAASGDIGSSNYQPGDGVWTLSSAGEITHVKYENGRYVPKESRDIPFFTRSCSSPYTISGGKGGFDRGVFDGLAVSPDQKIMYAVHNYSNATRAQAVDDANSGVSVYRYTGGHWYAYALRQVGGSWKIQQQRVDWNGQCGSGSRQSTYNPSNKTSKGARTNRNYTFDNSRTNFTSGTIINAGTPNEAYIFGGTDSTRFVGANGQNILKIFSFQPGNPGGVVKYLGYITTNQKYSTTPTDSGGSVNSVFGDFTSDAEGNVYAAVGQGSGRNLNLKVYKFSRDFIAGQIASPSKQFSYKGRYDWGDTDSDNYGFGNKGCGSIGGSEAGNVCAKKLVGGKLIVDKTIRFSGQVDGFSGFSIAPGNKITVGAKLSNGHSNTGTHGVVLQIDANGKETDDVPRLDASNIGSQVHSNTGGYWNPEHTDIEGALYAPSSPQPQPESRTITLKKTLIRSRVNLNDNFNVKLADRNSGRTLKTDNTDGRSGTFYIGGSNPVSISTSDLPVTFSEQAAGVSFDKYEVSVSCTANGQDFALADLGVPSKSGTKWSLNATIPAFAKGNIECTIVNTAKTVPTKTITVYKRHTLYDKSDKFDVGLTVDHQDHGRSTEYLPEGPYNWVAGQVVPVGQKVTLYDRVIKVGELTNYTQSQVCRFHDDPNRTIPLDGDSSFTVPSDGGKEIDCYIDNIAKPKQPHVTVYKHYNERYNHDDEFYGGFSWGNGPEDRKEGSTQSNIQDNFAGNDVKIAEGDLPQLVTNITVSEYGLENFGPNLRNYDIRISCTNGGRHGDEIAGYPLGGKQYWSFNVTNAGRNIDCYIDNTAHERNQKTVKLYKVFTGFANKDDVFDLGFQGLDDPKFRSTYGAEQGDPKFVTEVSVAPESNGTTLGITEVPVPNPLNGHKAKLDDYTRDLACYDANSKNEDKKIELKPTGDPNLWALTVTQNLKSDVISCYLTNTPTSKRSVTVKKIFENTKTTSGFKVNGYVTDDSNTVGNRFEVANTAGHTVGEAFNVTDQPKTIPSGSVNIHLHEDSLDGLDLTKYKISAVCQDADDHSVTIPGNANGSQWNATVQIPGNFTNDITCTITNKLPKPKSTTVTLYKQLNRFNPTDQFTVGLYDAQTGVGFPGASVYTRSVRPEHLTNVPPSHKDYDQYVAGEHEFTQSTDGFKFRVQEWAGDGATISNYDKNLFCQRYDFQSRRWVDFDTDFENVQDLQHGLSVDVKVPAEVTGFVHCYLQNTAKPKVKVVLYKDLKLADTTDQFSVGMSRLGADGNTSDSVISRMSTPNSIPAETSHQVLAEGYSRYQIGSYEYARDDKTGFNFKVEETANAGGVLDKYTSNLTCKYVANGSENTDAVTNVSEPQDNNGTRSISGVIPAGSTDAVVHCYLTNNPKPNTKVVLFKQVKKVKDGDDFSITLRPTYSTEYYAALGNYKDFQIKKSTADVAAEDKRVVNDGSGNELYTEYKIGEFPARPAGLDYKFEISETRSGSEVHLNDYVSKFTCKRVVNGVEQENPVFLVKTDYTKDSSDSTRKFAGMVIPQTETREVHCYLRNDPKPKGSITIHKISSIGGSDLSGSHWKVQQRIGNSGPFKDYGVIADDDTTTVNQLHDADNRSGYIKIDNLKIGTELEPVYYRVIETVAPAGFILPTKESSRTHSFTLYPGKAFGKDAQYQEKEVQNTPATSPELPFTGGWGTLPYMILGFVLTGGAVVAFVIAKPKKKTRPSHK